MQRDNTVQDEAPSPFNNESIHCLCSQVILEKKEVSITSTSTGCIILNLFQYWSQSNSCSPVYCFTNITTHTQHAILKSALQSLKTCLWQLLRYSIARLQEEKFSYSLKNIVFSWRFRRYAHPFCWCHQSILS